MAGSVPELCDTCSISATTICLHQQRLKFQDNQVFLLSLYASVFFFLFILLPNENQIQQFNIYI